MPSPFATGRLRSPGQEGYSFFRRRGSPELRTAEPTSTAGGCSGSSVRSPGGARKKRERRVGREQLEIELDVHQIPPPGLLDPVRIGTTVPVSCLADRRCPPAFPPIPAVASQEGAPRLTVAAPCRIRTGLLHTVAFVFCCAVAGPGRRSSCSAPLRAPILDLSSYPRKV